MNVLVQDSFEMQADAIQPGQTVVVIDDLIATGMIIPCKIKMDFQTDL